MSTIVDATTIGIGRDPMALVNVAEATGVNIVMGAGYYVDMVHPSDMDDRSEEQLASQIVEELTVGVGGTGSSGWHNRRARLLVAANPRMNGRCCERAPGHSKETGAGHSQTSRAQPARSL